MERAIARVATNGTIVCQCCNASDVTDDDHRAGCPVWDLRRALVARVTDLEAQVANAELLRDEWHRLADDNLARLRAAEAHWQELEHPFDKSEFDAMYERMVAAEAQVAALTSREATQPLVDAAFEWKDRALAAESRVEQLTQERDEARRFIAATENEHARARAAAEAALATTRQALTDTIEDAIWLTGAADLSNVPAWPEVRERLLARRALAAAGDNTTEPA